MNSNDGARRAFGALRERAIDRFLTEGASLGLRDLSAAAFSYDGKWVALASHSGWATVSRNEIVVRFGLGNENRVLLYS